MSALDLNDPSVSGLLTPAFKSVPALKITGTATLSQPPATVPAGTIPSRYELFTSGVSGGGLVANHLQMYSYYDPTVASRTINSVLDVYPSPNSNTNAGAASTPVWRTVSGIPLDGNAASANLATEATQTGTIGICANATVITDPGWTQYSYIAFSFRYGTLPAAAPTWALTIVGGVPTLTITCTAGSHFNYQIWHA